jgi:hypothetical protein
MYRSALPLWMVDIYLLAPPGDCQGGLKCGTAVAQKKSNLHLASVFHTFKGRFKLRMTTWQKLRGQFLSYNQKQGEKQKLLSASASFKLF